jgi:glycine betaine/proline transport system ATP-binding protein
VVRSLESGRDTIDDILQTDVPTVTSDTVDADLFHDSADTEVPLSVIDGDGRLTGDIPRVTLLAALGDISAKSNGDGDAEDGSLTSDGPGVKPKGKEVTA